MTRVHQRHRQTDGLTTYCSITVLHRASHDKIINISTKVTKPYKTSLWVFYTYIRLCLNITEIRTSSVIAHGPWCVPDHLKVDFTRSIEQLTLVSLRVTVNIKCYEQNIKCYVVSVANYTTVAFVYDIYGVNLRCDAKAEISQRSLVCS